MALLRPQTSVNHALKIARYRRILPAACALLATLALACLLTAHAADVKIEFIPPPMEGTISLGIYNDAGKLVRVLRKEADTDEFTVALNGLIAHWNGTDNAGGACPPGKYRARGWKVGELAVEGVDFVGNDWMTADDSPRISRITDLAVNSSGTPLIQAVSPGQTQAQVYAITTGTDPKDDEPQAGLTPQPDAASAFAAPIPTSSGEKSVLETTSAGGERVAPGAEGAVWKIDGAAVKKFSATGKELLACPWAADGSVAVKLAASPMADKIYVLAQSGNGQRVQGFDCSGLKPGASPKVLFDAGIRYCDRYEQVASMLKFQDDKPFVPSAVTPVILPPNPLFQDEPTTLNLVVTVDATGAVLATADGLPLTHISETPHLRWAVLGRRPGVKVLTVFESDGAVVSEFTVARLANIMEFDAGEITLPAAPAR